MPRLTKLSARALPRAVLLGLVHLYRYTLSPWLGASCRFEPTCSAYAIGVLERHGACAGTYLTLRRIARCQPWCEGGCDPVPATVPPLFSSSSRRHDARRASLPLDRTRP